MTTTTQEKYNDRTLGDIAATLPGATRVFRSFGLDFCCAGDVPLEEAATRRGLDINAVEQALDQLDATVSPDVPEDNGALIDHILSRYHEVHRRELPELVRLARKVEEVHAGHEQVPAGLADMLQSIIGELEVHMKKEELILFPAMRRGPNPRLADPIAQMRHDHDDHGEYVRRLEESTRGFTPPEGACRSWQALYAGVDKFADDLMEHIHLENNVLFPRFIASSGDNAAERKMS